MILNDLLTMGIVTDNTQIVLKIGGGPIEQRITGKWYEDHILQHVTDTVSTFTWQSNGVLVVRVAGEYQDSRFERLSRKANAVYIQHYISAHTERR